MPGYDPATTPTRGFAVDVSKRNDVVSFWHAIYQSSEGYWDRMAWTGNYTATTAGAEGTVSAAFLADTERRLNYVRAMAGVSANVRVNSGATVSSLPGDKYVPAASTSKGAAAQRSALMICRNYTAGSANNPGLNHDPAASNTAWTEAAWNANSKGNLAQGYYGPGAVDAYVQETAPGLSTWNTNVGHRRWVLFQKATDYATGDVPGSYVASTGRINPATNCLYVYHRAEELNEAAAPKFAFYPSAGYFPASLNTPYWSVSYPNAIFTGASVTVKNAAGTTLVTQIVSNSAAYADNTLVFFVPPSASVQQVAEDTRFEVTITGIQGTGVPSSLSYPVILINPDRLDETVAVQGSALPSLAGENYRIAPVPGAEAMQTAFFLRHAADWTEGAEASPAPAVIGKVSPQYSLISTQSSYFRTGSRSFRLTFPTYYEPRINGVPEQSFELDREILPKAGSQLQFYFKRGFMSASSRLVAEVSADGGLSWNPLGDEIAGVGNTTDTGFSTRSFPLPVTSEPLRVRFRYYYTGSGTLYTLETSAAQSGIWIDDISTTNCDVLERRGQVTTTAETSVAFNSTTAATPLALGQQWWLRSRAVLGGKAFPYGPSLVVSPVGPLQILGRTDPPAGGGASYRFIPALSGDGYDFQVETLTASTWTEGAEADPVPRVTDETSDAYDLLSDRSGYFATGSRSFRLGLATTTELVNSFTLQRIVVPGEGCSVSFWTRRSRMATSNSLNLEASEDGTNWTTLWTLAGNGTTADSAGTTRTVDLGAYAGKALTLRFAVRKGSAANQAWVTGTSGVWIDDIRVVNGWDEESVRTISMPFLTTVLRLDASTAGRQLAAVNPVRMRLRVTASGTAGAWGPWFTAVPTGTPATGFQAWIDYDYPDLQGGFAGDDDGDGLANGLEYAFGLSPVAAESLPQALTRSGEVIRMAQPLTEMRAGVTYAAEWSSDLINWSTQGVSVVLADGQITASAPAGSGKKFLRWKISDS